MVSALVEKERIELDDVGVVVKQNTSPDVNPSHKRRSSLKDYFVSQSLAIPKLLNLT